MHACDVGCVHCGVYKEPGGGLIDETDGDARRLA